MCCRERTRESFVENEKKRKRREVKDILSNCYIEREDIQTYTNTYLGAIKTLHKIRDTNTYTYKSKAFSCVFECVCVFVYQKEIENNHKVYNEWVGGKLGGLTVTDWY